MNWLAHIYLSEDHIDFQMGNFLADPLKGKVWQGASEKTIQGFLLHQKIDQFTDAHPKVLEAKLLLPKKFRYLKGIVLDVVYDYFLSNHWHVFSVSSLESFIEEFYRKAYEEKIRYPEEAIYFIERLVGTKLLNEYQNFNTLERTFERIDKRLSLKLLNKEKTVEYIPYIFDSMDKLEKSFLDFYPELQNFVTDNLGGERPIFWK